MCVCKLFRYRYIHKHPSHVRPCFLSPVSMSSAPTMVLYCFFPQVPGSKRLFAMARRRPGSLGCLALLCVLGFRAFTAFTGHSASSPQRPAVRAAEGETTHWSTFEDADWVLKCRLTGLGLGTSWNIWNMFLGVSGCFRTRVDRT